MIKQRKMRSNSLMFQLVKKSRAPRRRTNNPERALMKAFFDLLRWKYPKILAIHIPLEGKRSWREGKALKSAGMRAGVSDIYVIEASHGKFGLWIELKVGYNKLTPEQKEWSELVKARGHSFGVAYTLEEAEQLLKDYLKGVTYEF